MAEFPILLTALLLGVTGFFYTMGGFAGGSLFIAVLLLSGLQPGQAALGGLVFNVFSTLSSLTRWRVHMAREFLWFLVGSVPAAFLAGLLSLPDPLLRGVMGGAITVGGVAVLLATYPLRTTSVSAPMKVMVGAAVGVVAGLTGIGGGVYLAPILIVAGIAQPKTAAATTTIFILLNSLSGIAARTPRLSLILPNPLLLAAIPVVVVAAQLGGYLGARRLTQTNVRRVIGLVLMSVGAYILSTSI